VAGFEVSTEDRRSRMNAALGQRSLCAGFGSIFQAGAQ
jgi:hypothetical protein